MSLRNVGDLKDEVSGIISGTNLNKVTGLYKAFQRAARTLVQKADVSEATAKQNLTLYDGVYDYEISENLFGGALIDIRPQGVTRYYGESVTKVPMSDFDRKKSYALFDGTKVTFEYKDGVPIMRVASVRPMARTILDVMNDDSGWTAGGSASGLAEDRTVFYDSNGSLRFTLTGASSGTLEKTLSTALNLEEYEDVAVGFLAFRLPDDATASQLTSMTLRIGNSNAIYDSVSVTEGFLGAWTVGEWLLVAFDMAASASTGSVDWTATDYVQLSMAHSATMVNVRVGGLWLALPSPHEAIYQTAAIFLENGARAKTITDVDTEIVLGDSAFNLYAYECALAIAKQTTQVKKAGELQRTLYGGEGPGEPGLYVQYRGDNPSQELRTVGSYYEN